MDRELLALIVSFVAMVIVAASYFTKKKLHYLSLQLLGILFLIMSYFFTEQFFAMVGIAIGGLRTVTFFLYENKEKRAPIAWSFLFAGLSLASYIVINLLILKTAQPLDLLFLAGLVAYAFIFRIRSLKAVRFAMIAPTLLSVLYNFLSGAALFVSVSYTFEFSANIVSIFKYHVFRKNSKGK